MKTFSEHITHIKGKPHHIRKRIAFAIAASGTGLIALVWLVGNLSLGTFALSDRSFADATGQGTVEVKSSPQNLAAAAAALLPQSEPAHIEIVDTASSTRPVKKAEQTTIPF